MSPAGVILAGNWIVDRVKVIDTYPDQDRLANILSSKTSNGGGPFNVGVDLARLGIGIPLHALGCIGDDADGQWILKQCDRWNIDASGLQVMPGEDTSYTDAMTVASTGRRTFFHARGANAKLSADHGSGLPSFKIFYLGYLLLLDTLDAPDPEFGSQAGRLLARARASGAITVVDVVSEQSDRFAQVVLPTLPHIDVLLLNEVELSRTVNREIDMRSPDSLADGLASLFDHGLRKWAVVHTPQVAVARSKDGEVVIQRTLQIPQEMIRGATGAGDGFAAGFLAGLHEDLPVQICLHQGVCVAAATLFDETASDAVPPLEDCLGLAGTYGVRPDFI